MNAVRIPSMRRPHCSAPGIGAHHLAFSPISTPFPFPLIKSGRMSQSVPRQTKKQKKALAFRTRQKTGKSKNKNLDDEDGLDFPIDENQDLGGLAALPPEAAEVSAGGRSGSRKGKAENGGQRQVRSSASKKRKREGEEEGDIDEEQPRKKSKEQKREGEDVEYQPQKKSKEQAVLVEETIKVKKVQPQRFILFIGAFLSRPTSKTNLTCDDCRQSEVLYDKGCHSFSFLLLR